MLTTLRAMLAVVMLLGFYVLGLAIIGGLCWLTYLAFEFGQGAVGGKIGYVTLLVTIAILAALWRIIRAKPAPPSGLPIAPQQAPELWAMVTELAGALKTRRPDQILLVPEVNAAVTEQARLLGLLGGKRTMLIGVPLLQAFSVAQLRSVLAHELGHYSGNHTRLGPIAYRGRIAIVDTIQNLDGLVALLFTGYARIYLLVEAAVSRRQELEADRVSVQVAGRSTAQSALRELSVIDAAWNFYFGRYVAAGWEAGYAPDDLFGGFGELLRHRAGELERLRAEAPPSKGSRWDTHPPIAARVEAMARMADAPIPVDARPATVVIPNFSAACAALAASALNLGNREVVTWEQFTALATAASYQQSADAIYRAVASSRHLSSADLNTVLDLASAGELGTVSGPLREAPGEALTVLLSSAAVRSGAATWRHNWAGPAILAGTDGSTLDLGVIVQLALVPQTVPAARARLQEIGVDAAKASLVRATVTPSEGVLTAVSKVKIDGVAHDVIVVENGLILVPAPKKGGSRDRLVKLLRSASIEVLARQHRFLPFEEIISVNLRRKLPFRADVGLRNGQTMAMQDTWGSESVTEGGSVTLRNSLCANLSSSSATAPAKESAELAAP